jgi:hypothetical protein
MTLKVKPENVIELLTNCNVLNPNANAEDIEKCGYELGNMLNDFLPDLAKALEKNKLREEVGAEFKQEFRDLNQKLNALTASFELFKYRYEPLNRDETNQQCSTECRCRG